MNGDPTARSEEPVAEQEGSNKRLGTSRRKFVAASAASWASVSLAGCSDLLGGQEDEEEEEPPYFVVTDEVIAGSEGIPEGASGFVTPGRPQRSFIPGMQAVFKIGVWDPETGDIVSDEALEEANVDLDRDETVELEFSRSDREWSGDWMIPEEAETGTVGYTVQVSNGAHFTDVGIAESEIEIIEYEGPAANYVATINTYTTTSRANGFVQSCLPQHNYAPGMKVGFEIGVFDGATGDALGDEDIEEAVIEMENGDVVNLGWEEEDELWRSTWDIPEDQEIGTVTYELQVTADREVHQVGGHRARHGIAQDSIEVIDPETEVEEE